jgi:nuclear pore complex protein Nup98-Nup96
MGRGLSKSISTSSLRRSFNVEDSILSPGAFSASSGSRFPGSTGSHKKLIINRDMRSDLFSSPSKDKQTQDTVNGSRKLTKRVSFDTSTVPAIENGGGDSDAQTENGASATAQDLGYLRPATRSTASATNGTAKQASSPGTPEMEPVKGNELAIVHEEESSQPAAQPADVSGGDSEPGAYWMQPTKEDILDMNRMQRQKVVDFTVGRENVGAVRFKVPVDLSNIDLDQLFNNIVILEARSATVYPVAAKKPPVGKGLNVPAQISLEQSWPRARDKRTPLQDKSGVRFTKHVERLKRIENTTFESYDPDTGVWTFSVEHFTTYGLDYDEEETELKATEDSASKDFHPAQPLPSAGQAVPSPDVDEDDTFEFRRNRRAVPGAFDGTALSDDEEMAESDHLQPLESPTSEDSEMLQSAQSAYDIAALAEEYHNRIGSFEGGFDNNLSGGIDRGVAHDDADVVLGDQGELQLSRIAGDEQFVPAGIMRARMRAIKKSTAPTRIQVAGGDDWSQVLQQSVRAPRRTDRAELRALNESGAAWDVDDGESQAPQPHIATDGAGFATSLDLMRSLFDKGPPQPAQASPAKGFVKVGVPLVF